MASKSILVVSLFRPEVIEIEEDGEPRLDHAAKRNDDMDLFNHPRYRRAVILKELGKYADAEGIVFENPPNPLSDLTAYQNVHSERLVEFLSTAWKRWHDLGVHGQDEAFSHGDDDDDDTTSSLVPGSHILPRDPHQRPSKSVMGQIAFFCTDIITPVFAQLKQELLWDGAVVQQAVASVQKYKVVYALATHPGHHSSSDAFGGYCYLNHAAFAARLLQGSGYSKVAVLDVDYHGGNGTASIFYEDPSVLMISIHCHPDWEYPFHTGFEDETGEGKGKGVTLNLPLRPGTTWAEYSVALKKATDTINSFGANALVISLGLDTLLGDPCAIKGAGFKLSGDDYKEMGRSVGKDCKLPTVVIQEGGYKLDDVPKAAADVVIGCAEGRC